MACTIALGAPLFSELHDSPRALVPQIVLAFGDYFTADSILASSSEPREPIRE